MNNDSHDRKRKEALERTRYISGDLATRIFEAAPDAIILVDSKGRILKVNPQGELCFGYSRTELLGQEVEILIPQRFRRAHVGHRKHYKSQPSFRPHEQNLELFALSKSGKELPVDISLSPVEVNGELLTLAIIRDLSRQKKIENELTDTRSHVEKLKVAESFFANISDVITLIDRGGRILAESPSVERVLGYLPEERMGENIFGYVHEEDREKIVTRFKRALENPGQVQQEVVRIRRKDGSWAHLESAGVAPENGETDDLVITSRDLTARLEAEAELLQSREELRQAHKMEAVGRLAGGIAHDFNNLLTVILSSAEIVLDRMNPETDGYEDFDSIRSAAERGAALTTQLLAFGRQQALNPEILDLNQVVRATERFLYRVIGEDIELVSELSDDLEQVKVDPTQIQQVLLNLAINARDAMPDGGRLTISTEKLEKSGSSRICLSVADTGHGMDEERTSKVFEPFFSTKPEGTGLGLSMVYGIIKQSGGDISVESRPARGSIFRIKLPVVTENPSGYSKQADSCGEVRGGSELILLVEDEETVRRVVELSLKKLGYSVISVATMKSALETHSELTQSVDLLISDVVLKEGDGRKLAQQLLEKQPGLAVLFISGYAPDTLEGRNIPLAQCDFLQKPFSRTELADRVRNLLDKE